jgi:hypothetical protein
MMSEAEFERRVAASGVDALLAASDPDAGGTAGLSIGAGGATGYASATVEPEPGATGYASARSSGAGGLPTSAGGGTGSAGATPTTRNRSPRAKPAAKPKRVQRMFAIEDDLDRKLWLYAIHVGKDRSDVVNDLLRPVVASMVLYDSRDRRASASRSVESAPDAELAEAG